MRWPSAEGHGAVVVCQTSSGSPARRAGRRSASVHSGVWSTIQSRNAPSSLRVAGSTDTNRPPRLAMWSMFDLVASFESAM